MADVPILVSDTATKLDPRHRGAVVVCGSHGGVYPGYLAAKAGLRAVLLNDAGVGLERAGIGCLAYCQALGMAAATVAHDSARIGDGEDMRRRGRISHVNQVAAALGVAPGQTVEQVLAPLVLAPEWHATPPAWHEGRHVAPDEPGKPRLICVDFGIDGGAARTLARSWSPVPMADCSRACRNSCSRSMRWPPCSTTPGSASTRPGSRACRRSTGAASPPPRSTP